MFTDLLMSLKFHKVRIEKMESPEYDCPAESEDSPKVENEEDIQSKLDRLLGRDSDSDKSFVPSDTDADDEDSDIEYMEKIVCDKTKAIMTEMKRKISPRKTEVKKCSDLYIRELLYLSNLKNTREIDIIC